MRNYIKLVERNEMEFHVSFSDSKTILKSDYLKTWKYKRT